MPARILPVLDLKGAHAVRAIAGVRAHYQPLASRLHGDSEPIAIAVALRAHVGHSSLYLADIDAISGHREPRLDLYRELAARGLDLWVDAGVRTADDGTPLIGSGVATIVVGLETVAGPDALAAIVARFDPARVVFSLDLRDGVPIIAAGADWEDEPGAIAATALGLGVRRLLLLDLARVGTGRGPGTRALLAGLRAIHPEVEFSAGGGVAGPEDVEALARAGASFILVGSALHDGRIGPTPVPW